MRSEKLDANIDPMDFLEQVAILGNHPYLLQSFSCSMKSSDEIWRYFCLWILAPGIQPGAPDLALTYQPVG